MACNCDPLTSLSSECDAAARRVLNQIGRPGNENQADAIAVEALTQAAARLRELGR